MERGPGSGPGGGVATLTGTSLEPSAGRGLSQPTPCGWLCSLSIPRCPRVLAALHALDLRPLEGEGPVQAHPSPSAGLVVLLTCWASLHPGRRAERTGVPCLLPRVLSECDAVSACPLLTWSISAGHHPSCVVVGCRVDLVMCLGSFRRQLRTLSVLKRDEGSALWGREQRHPAELPLALRAAVPAGSHTRGWVSSSCVAVGVLASSPTGAAGSAALGQGVHWGPKGEDLLGKRFSVSSASAARRGNGLVSELPPRRGTHASSLLKTRAVPAATPWVWMPGGGSVWANEEQHGHPTVPGGSSLQRSKESPREAISRVCEAVPGAKGAFRRRKQRGFSQLCGLACSSAHELVRFSLVLSSLTSGGRKLASETPALRARPVVPSRDSRVTRETHPSPSSFLARYLHVPDERGLEVWQTHRRRGPDSAASHEQKAKMTLLLDFVSQPPSKMLSSILGKRNLQFAGTSISLTISTASLSLRTPDSKQIIANHHMQSISFASGGDPDTTDYVAYVAKDPVNRRGCLRATGAQRLRPCSTGMSRHCLRPAAPFKVTEISIRSTCSRLPDQLP
ncbi:hypothetical protein CB1_000293011 [Camelus ferus]|nr:hypothetical protein CB1_000293011 [Camelus ferus]